MIDHADIIDMEFWSIIDASFTQDEYNEFMWVCKNIIAMY